MAFSDIADDVVLLKLFFNFKGVFQPGTQNYIVQMAGVNNTCLAALHMTIYQINLKMKTSFLIKAYLKNVANCYIVLL